MIHCERLFIIVIVVSVKRNNTFSYGNAERGGVVGTKIENRITRRNTTLSFAYRNIRSARDRYGLQPRDGGSKQR